VSHSFGCIPKSGIAGSNGRSMFSFLSSLQIFFQSGFTKKPNILREVEGTLRKQSKENQGRVWASLGKS
jgi:hypothetical protein